MNDRPIPEYRVLLTVDLEDYSSRNDSEQRALQSALGDAIDHAADAAELNRQAWLRQLGGDGIFAILPAGTDMSRLMDTFIRELDARLGSYNRRRAGDAWSRMRLRMAVHIGPVHVDGATGWPGQHVVQPARLRDSDPVRAAMSAQPGADLAVIVSAEVYRDYITQGPGEPRPNEFHPVRVRVKKQDYKAYLYLPGYDVGELGDLAEFDHAVDAPAESRPRPPEDRPAASSPSAGRDVIGSLSNLARDGGRIQYSSGDMTVGSEPPGTASDE